MALCGRRLEDEREEVSTGTTRWWQLLTESCAVGGCATAVALQGGDGLTRNGQGGPDPFVVDVQAPPSLTGTAVPAESLSSPNW